MKKSLILLSLISVAFSYSQEIKSISTSAVGDNNAYFIKSKFVSKEELIKIKSDEIESVNFIQRDTIIDKRRYSGQIFVVLKNRINK